jgi:hypothetical protein
MKRRKAVNNNPLVEAVVAWHRQRETMDAIVREIAGERGVQSFEAEELAERLVSDAAIEVMQLPLPAVPARLDVLWKKFLAKHRKEEKPKTSGASKV